MKGSKTARLPLVHNDPAFERPVIVTRTYDGIAEKSKSAEELLREANLRRHERLQSGHYAKLTKPYHPLGLREPHQTLYDMMQTKRTWGKRRTTERAERGNFAGVKKSKQKRNFILHPTKKTNDNKTCSVLLPQPPPQPLPGYRKTRTAARTLRAKIFESEDRKTKVAAGHAFVDVICEQRPTTAPVEESKRIFDTILKEEREKKAEELEFEDLRESSKSDELTIEHMREYLVTINMTIARVKRENEKKEMARLAASKDEMKAILFSRDADEDFISVTDELMTAVRNSQKHVNSEKNEALKKWLMSTPSARGKPELKIENLLHENRGCAVDPAYQLGEKLTEFYKNREDLAEKEMKAIDDFEKSQVKNYLRKARWIDPGRTDMTKGIFNRDIQRMRLETQRDQIRGSIHEWETKNQWYIKLLRMLSNITDLPVEIGGIIFIIREIVEGGKTLTKEKFLDLVKNTKSSIHHARAVQKMFKQLRIHVGVGLDEYRKFLLEWGLPVPKSLRQEGAVEATQQSVFSVKAAQKIQQLAIRNRINKDSKAKEAVGRMLVAPPRKPKKMGSSFQEIRALNRVEHLRRQEAERRAQERIKEREIKQELEERTRELQLQAEEMSKNAVNQMNAKDRAAVEALMKVEEHNQIQHVAPARGGRRGVLLATAHEKEEIARLSGMRISSDEAMSEGVESVESVPDLDQFGLEKSIDILDKHLQIGDDAEAAVKTALRTAAQVRLHKRSRRASLHAV